MCFRSTIECLVRLSPKVQDFEIKHSNIHTQHKSWFSSYIFVTTGYLIVSLWSLDQDGWCQSKSRSRSCHIGIVHTYMYLMYPVQWNDILYSWCTCVCTMLWSHVSYPDSENHSDSAQSVFGCRSDNPCVIASVWGIMSWPWSSWSRGMMCHNIWPEII